MSDKLRVICVNEVLVTGLFTNGNIYDATYVNRDFGLIGLHDDGGYYRQFYMELDKIGPLAIIPMRVYRNLILEELLDEKE